MGASPMPMPYALCPMPYALCPMPYALCPMPYALCPREHLMLLRKVIPTLVYLGTPENRDTKLYQIRLEYALIF